MELIKIIRRMKMIKKNLDFAEQQLVGFIAAKRGDSLTRLVEAMALSFDEWGELEENGSLGFLTQEENDEVKHATN